VPWVPLGKNVTSAESEATLLATAPRVVELMVVVEVMVPRAVVMEEATEALPAASVLPVRLPAILAVASVT
jgi:hypothetical protein